MYSRMFTYKVRKYFNADMIHLESFRSGQKSGDTSYQS
jgi:hypothetical protein